MFFIPTLLKLGRSGIVKLEGRYLVPRLVIKKRILLKIALYS